MNPTPLHGRRRPHRWPGRHCRVWLERIDRTHRQIRCESPPTIAEAESVLFDTDRRTSARERLLIALIDHPDTDAAAALLDNPRLPLDTPRLRFAHYIARRRLQRRCHNKTRRAA